MNYIYIIIYIHAAGIQIAINKSQNLNREIGRRAGGRAGGHSAGSMGGFLASAAEKLFSLSPADGSADSQSARIPHEGPRLDMRKQAQPARQ